MYVVKVLKKEGEDLGRGPIERLEGYKAYIENPEGVQCDIGSGWIELMTLKNDLVENRRDDYYVLVNGNIEQLTTDNFDDLISNLSIELVE